MMQAVLARLAKREDLPGSVAREAMELIASGKATEAQIAALVTALRLKGESAEEIASFAQVLQVHAISVFPKIRGMLVDTCGTGGDGAGTFNISTAAALVAAGAGVPVVKHGNRSVSSSCGSADVLEALGVRIDLSPDRCCAVIEETGIGFLFAPLYHPALRHAAKVRKDLGFSSIFNLLGPLLNPARAQARLCGVYSPGLVPVFAACLQSLGAERAMVVHGGGLDEITVSGSTLVTEISQGVLCTYTLTPEGLGIPRSPPSALAGGSPAANAEIIRDILSGANGPTRDVTLLNAGAAIYLGGSAPDLAAGIARAEEAIDSGAAREKLEALVIATGGMG
ncbi:MAG: anthranilate phosphoribosyltransferase [Methanomicrobiaceae archaeon]|nr:anthranilate phosphoribosyltransferase [Methanomicrobiaceae archaeon]